MSCVLFHWRKDKMVYLILKFLVIIPGGPNKSLWSSLYPKLTHKFYCFCYILFLYLYKDNSFLATMVLELIEESYNEMNFCEISSSLITWRERLEVQKGVKVPRLALMWINL